METRGLLGTNDLTNEDIDQEHPFLTSKAPINKDSLLSSPSYKKALVFLVSFLIAIFIGFIVATTAGIDIAAQNAALVFTLPPTLSPTSSTSFINNDISHDTSSIIAKPTIKPSYSPTPKPSNKPTIKPTKNPIKKPTKKPTKKTTPKPTSKTPTKSPIKTVKTTKTPTKPIKSDVTTKSPSKSPIKSLEPSVKTTKKPTKPIKSDVTTKSPTKSPSKSPIKSLEPSVKTTKKPMKSPTKPRKTVKPTKSPTTKSDKHIKSSVTSDVNSMEEIVLKGAINKNVSFQSSALSTDLNKFELRYLKVNIDVITVNEDEGLSLYQPNAFNGAYRFNYKYPKDPTNQYSVNEIRRTCYNIEFDSKSSTDIVLIQIKFNRFSVENGFDRVLIRHFNDSFIDLPQSYTGYHEDLLIEYVMDKGSTKSICIEFQSDDTVTDHGIDYDVIIRYDLCEWTDWSECYTIPLWGKRWSRGPFMNGKCGLGTTSKGRLATDTTEKDYEGFATECSNIDRVYPTEYCIKRNCEDWNNFNDSEFDPEKVPGQGWYNLSRYYNGAGRIDPKYPDPFRMYLSVKNSVFNDIKDDAWVEELHERLHKKLEEIVNEHQDVKMLEYAILDPNHRGLTAEYLGAKVLDSLINGKPFIAALTGDSVTSGHDNMFMSTYPMQLQSRLRKWWTEIGNKGASFLTRNYGVGGGPSSDAIGFMPRSMVTETFPDPFSKLNTILDDNYDLWYRNGYPIRKMDINTFEFHFVEGAGTQSTRELHLRESAYLGAIWAVIQPTPGLNKVSQSCKKWEEINATMFNNWKWNKWDREKFKFIKEEYFNKMGVAALDPNYGLSASCPLYKEGTVKLGEGSDADDGQPPDGQMYAYASFWLKVNWHPNSMGHRLMSDVISYWIIHSAAQFLHKYKNVIAKFNNIDDLKVFLEEKSGGYRWRESILKSIVDHKYDEFVDPSYCSKYTNETDYDELCLSIPFAITNTRPNVFNTHNLLNEYLYGARVEGIDNWNKYLSSKGWKWESSNTIVSIDLKKGAEGNMDTFWNLKPDSMFFLDQFNKFLVLDGFHDHLIKEKMYLQFMVKTPKFGSGSIKIFNGFHCNAWIEEHHLVKVYVNKLENIENDNNNLGDLIKGNDCIMRGLELNTKYVVTYVPYNITAKSEGKNKEGFADYYIMFLLAF